jgi:hypothetical protein
VSFIQDAQGVSFIHQLVVEFVLYVVGIATLFLIISTQVKETNYFLEDNVIVPHKFEERMIAEGVISEDQTAKEKRKEELAREADEKRGGRLAVEEVSV